MKESKDLTERLYIIMSERPARRRTTGPHPLVDAAVHEFVEDNDIPWLRNNREDGGVGIKIAVKKRLVFAPWNSAISCSSSSTYAWFPSMRREPLLPSTKLGSFASSSIKAIRRSPDLCRNYQ